MFYHKIIISSLVAFSFCLIIGCATTYAPEAYLPDTDDVQTETYGGWITLVTMPDSLSSEEKWMQYSGEFISLDEENVYLLYDSLYRIPKIKIYSSIIELDEKNSTEYGLWTAGGTAATISNGWFLILTAPLWLLGGIPATVGESVRDRYETEYPDSVYWMNVQKFARFPQGLPENVQLKELKQKEIILND